jgi:hypothetical protein
MQAKQIEVTVFHWPIKTKIISHDYYYINLQLFLQKYQAFPAVVAFNQGLPIFHFLL